MKEHKCCKEDKDNEKHECCGGKHNHKDEEHHSKCH